LVSVADLDKVLVSPTDPVRAAMHVFGEGHGVVLVVDEHGSLAGIVTDGDVRRAILADFDLDRTMAELLELPRLPIHAKPLTAPEGTPSSELVRMMTEVDVRHIPIVDAGGRVKDLAVLDDLVKEGETTLTAVVMAGGLGTRLRPLTKNLPKPMLPVGDRPLLEHTIVELRAAGIGHLNIATHYKGQMIEDHFGDGSKFDMEIGYVDEETPLGTAGAISLMEPVDGPVLVINGDILTQVNYRSVLRYHEQHKADMTVGLRHHEYTIPFGVVQMDGVSIKGVSEKPTEKFLVNAGIYLLGPAACARVPKGRRYDMTDLIQDLVDEGRTVVGFPISEYWLDIGRLEDYQQAVTDAELGKRDI
jgi:dTDP-glucose pyrophosphorylase